MTLDPNDPDSWPPGEWNRWVEEQPWIRMRLHTPIERDILLLLEPEAGVVARAKYPDTPLFTLEDMHRIMDRWESGKMSSKDLEALLNIAAKFGAGLVPEDEHRSSEKLSWKNPGKVCKLCGGNKWWHNRGGHPVCYRCHPPTGPASS